MSEVSKSSQAYRTISEVSEDLGVPQHVLRFWETKFSSIRPMKRGGNRRYYRPEDIQLLRAINRLLYIDGYTIRGVQKLIREKGIREIAALHGGPLPAEEEYLSPRPDVVEAEEASENPAGRTAATQAVVDMEVVNQSRLEFEPDPAMEKTPLFMALPEREEPVAPKTEISDAIARLQRVRANIHNALGQAG
jgi:DNA-binding transcriptional MerR regulator